MTTKLEGFKELETALAEIEKKATAKGVMRRALKKAAQPVVDAAIGFAPEGPTGNLKKSITISTKLSKRQAAKNRKLVADGKAAVEMFIGPDYNVAGRHAHLVEFGTGPHINGGTFAGSQHPGTAPQPFMRPAWDAEGRKTLDRLGKEMWSEIEKTAARAAKKAARG
tara:strand:+ start:2306 stop:2806 length:501 start_codon:yes stop_codon:yes gene_type:complete